MKKLICILTLLLATQMSFSQHNMDQLFKKLSKEKEVTRVKIGSMMMGFAGLFADTMGVNGVEVLSFEGCGENTRQKLREAMRKLDDPAFDTMVSTNEGGEQTKVMVKIQKDTIKELVVFTTEDGGALVRIKGNIKPSDIEKVVKEHTNG